MTDKPRKPDDQQAFENELQSVQAEWDQMEKAEPPDLVDQAVRNAARRDLEPRKKRRPLRWLGGFATAAVVVLAITVTLEQEPPLSEPPPQDAGELRRDVADPKRQETATMKSTQKPLPSAQPHARTREAKRQNPPVQAAAEEAENNALKSAIIPPPVRADQLSMTPGIAEKSSADQVEAAEAQAIPEEDQDQAPRSAEDWVEQMLQLRDYGQMKRLAGELAAFRHYYPDYPLPEQLAEPQP